MGATVRPLRVARVGTSHVWKAGGDGEVEGGAVGPGLAATHQGDVVGVGTRRLGSLHPMPDEGVGQRSMKDDTHLGLVRACGWELAWTETLEDAMELGEARDNFWYN